mmetsp:Transcript_19598/g.25411  ORF Transcript_19598/g.25411 Transcript_19598/m.25411 type:complete len:207 (+) Transcript_19598:107-727(+)
MKRKQPRYREALSQEKKIKPSIDIARSSEAASLLFNEKHTLATPKLSKLERFGEYGSVKPSRFVPVPEALSLEKLVEKQIGEGEAQLKRPKVVVLTLSAKRACDVHRSLSSLRCPCLKLFAKHMKVKEQVALLDSREVVIVVGTPNRIFKLAEQKSLLFDETSLVVVDMHKDKKEYDVLTMPGVSQDFFTLFRQHLQGSKAKLSLF